MKKYINVTIILLFIITLILIPNLSLADKLELEDLNKYGGEISPDHESKKFDIMANKVISIIQTVGSILSVIVLIAVGIRYMLHSTAEKAEYKKTALAYVIGCVMIFSISNLLSIIYGIVKSM